MNNSIENLDDIKNKIKLKLNNLKKDKVPKIIAVSKTFSMDKILPLVFLTLCFGSGETFLASAPHLPPHEYVGNINRIINISLRLINLVILVRLKQALH
jgi:tRNA G46 methylase TrmB